MDLEFACKAIFIIACIITGVYSLYMIAEETKSAKRRH